MSKKIIAMFCFYTICMFCIVCTGIKCTTELKICGAHIVIFIRLGIKFKVENIGR